ncbi:hypothetical protein B6U70_03290 [Euryarchaeota archaeon ex4484_162]|nr:MAG: hypothetical protein B6U70_03290 [Euryarchaeota archaeon ex4484_162]
MLYSIFLYPCRFSLKDVTVAIAIFIKRSGTAVWKWLQKLGNILENKTCSPMVIHLHSLL